jgi:hypothetical protein
MAVAIHTSDGQEVVVKGGFVEVRQHLVERWGRMGEFELEYEEGRRVLINTQQITSLAETVGRER